MSAYQPMPPDCFLHDMEPFGVRRGRKTWRRPDRKRYYQWDELHGHVEVYSKRGKHMGVADTKGKVFAGPDEDKKDIDV